MSLEDREAAREAALDAADEAIAEGRLEDALRALGELDADDPDRLVSEGLLLLELGDLPSARRCRDALAAHAEAADLADAPAVRLLSARVALAEWRVDEARAALVELARDEPDDPDVLEELAVCHELAGELDEADRLQARALELTGEPPIPRLSPEAFDTEVARAIDALPPAHRRVLELAEVIVEPMPDVEWVEVWGGADELGETPPTMLGLFVGASELERDPDAPEPPPRIFLFQRNIERQCESPDRLLDEIRTTFLHELGHLLGFDEDGVAELGLE